jgi:hypothetical protein
MSEPSDPLRFSDAEPSSELGRLMTSAQRDLPSDADLAALAERLGSVLGPAHGRPPVPRGYSMLAKLGVATGLAALIAAGLFAARKHPGTPTPAPVASPALVASPRLAPEIAAAAPASDTAIALNIAPVASGASPATARSSTAPSPKSAAEPAKSGARPLDGPSEPVLLEHARRVLASDPSAALALTNQDATLFPHGILAQEREVIAIEALRRLNRTAEADRRAATFAKAFPGSVHQRAVEDASAK